LGQLDEAERLHREALRLSQQIGDRPALSARKAILAMTLLLRGKFEEARQLASESLALCQDLGYRRIEDWVSHTLGETLLHIGQYQQAKQQADHSLTLVTEKRPSRNQRLDCLLGDLALVASSYVEAQAAFAESAHISREEGDNRVGLALAGQGYAACRLGQWPQARQHLADALTSTLALKTYMPAVYALPGVALLLAATGAGTRAIEIWTLAKCHPFVANSRWFADVAGRELEAVAASLPPEVAEAARERGRTLDLWETAEALRAELEAS
jgi:tetratricopeptide (TPR) repeat protein